MALAPVLRIATLQGRFPIVDPQSGIPTSDFIDALNAAFGNIETIVNNQGELLNAVVAAQNAADAAQAAANSAQAAADAAQDAVDNLVIPPTATRTVTSNTAATPTDGVILVDASGGAVTVALLDAGVGTPITITKIDGSANSVNVAAQAGQDVNGSATFAFSLQYESHTFAADSVSAWYG